MEVVKTYVVKHPFNQKRVETLLFETVNGEWYVNTPIYRETLGFMTFQLNPITKGFANELIYTE